MTPVQLCTYVFTHVCMYACMQVCIYVNMYMRIYIFYTKSELYSYIEQKTIHLHPHMPVKFSARLNWIPTHGSKSGFCLSFPSQVIGSKSWNAGGRNTEAIREICCQTLSIKKENTTLGACGETASEDQRQMSRKKTLSTNNQCKFITNPRQCQEKYDLYVSRGHEACSGATWQEDGGSRMWGGGLGRLEARNEVVPQERFLSGFQPSPPKTQKLRQPRVKMRKPAFHYGGRQKSSLSD